MNLPDSFSELPEKGFPKEEILRALEEKKNGDANWKEGKTWSLVYHLGDEHTAFVKRAFEGYFSENALNPMAFRSLKRMESDVVRMTASFLRGGSDAVGTMTSGGTESCLLAVKTYRDLARAKKPWIRKPEMIAADSVHVAWEKGAKYFDVKLVHVPLDSSFRMDVEAVKKKINRNTVLIVASAPDYPHGMVDPIGEIGALAGARGIPFHVDSCLGGFLLPFAESLGYPVPAFDFRVPGVTSMSADVHKYGFAAKGASVLVYRNMDYLEHQFFVYGDWPGGVFASPGLLGTRPGGAIAAAWASMTALGKEGYLANAKIIMETTKKLLDGISAIPGLAVVGSPPGSVFAYRSVKGASDSAGHGKRIPDIFLIGDRLEARGWHIDRLQKPEALHAMVTPRHADAADGFLADLREAVKEALETPELAKKGNAAMYGMIARVPLRSVIKAEVLKMMRGMYGKDGTIPG
jgi:glutamate/tyrosine decarboxylase-like PLP-dependent enzyme